MLRAILVSEILYQHYRPLGHTRAHSLPRGRGHGCHRRPHHPTWKNCGHRTRAHLPRDPKTCPSHHMSTWPGTGSHTTDCWPPGGGVVRTRPIRPTPQRSSRGPDQAQPRADHLFWPRAPLALMSSGFYSQNGRWPDPKSSKQKGGVGYFPNYSIFCILLECCC